jgi:hypothetical protein
MLGKAGFYLGAGHIPINNYDRQFISFHAAQSKRFLFFEELIGACKFEMG